MSFRKFLGNPVWIFLILNVGINIASSNVLLYSLFSYDGLSGNVAFSWLGPGTNVTIEVNVTLAGGTPSSEPEEFDWGIYDWPVRYDVRSRCSEDPGNRNVDLSTLLGKLTIPSEKAILFETDKLNVIGENSIWGRSLWIKGSRSACANIQGVGGEAFYEARFHAPVGGSVWIKMWMWDLNIMTNDSKGTIGAIWTDLFNTREDEPSSSNHDWTLFITDILDDKEHRSTCDFLSRVYDPLGKEECDDEGCPQGMLTKTHGKLRVGTLRGSRFSRKFYTTSSLTLPDLRGHRRLYLGIMDYTHPSRIAACSKLQRLRHKRAMAVFNSKGVTGKILMEQVSPFTPTDLTLDLNGLEGEAGGFHIHLFPATLPYKPKESKCLQMSGHFNPFEVDFASSPSAGHGTHDHYEVGDLSGKHGLLTGLYSISSTVTDHSLPLYGPHSIVGRGIVVHNFVGGRWICANIRLLRPVIRAAVVFRYPFVGEMVFEQEEDGPLEDTTVFVAPLVYADGSYNDTTEHNWIIHNKLPGKDFYNWTERCITAGGHFNPFKVSLNELIYKNCGASNSERCEVGDLSSRHGELSVAGSIQSAFSTRRLFTDTNLPLSGPHSIIGHSIVIYDKYGPKARGDRMACSGIYRRFRHKGVVKEWTATPDDGSVEGKIEFIQESEFDPAVVEVQLQGLQEKASGYHVHMVPMEMEKLFPCAASIVYGHFNPLGIDPTSSPPSGTGTDDLYEMGDLSGKYGSLDHLSDRHATYDDHNLSLFGASSIMGRSVVIHKKEKSERWFCGNIVWGYAPSEARQVSAIASFHNPNGFAWGYIRMRQVIYDEDIVGETFMEVNLRHPGRNDRNITRGHNWSVYVNPVGVDASVKFFQSRCVAAGFRWNPFHVHLANPNMPDFYEQECTPEFPLRCEVGDLSGRLGPIDIGDDKYVFVDRNLPLAGKYSVMGKSIVIHNEQGRAERFACANIEPDHDIVKWVNLKRTTRFSPSVFMDDMRNILGAPEWVVMMDSRTLTYSEKKDCVTFKVHFLGPLAHKLEVDFSRLLVGAIMPHPPIVVPGHILNPKRKKKVEYRVCGSQDPGENEQGRNWWNFGRGSGSLFTSSFVTIWASVVAGIIVH